MLRGCEVSARPKADLTDPQVQADIRALSIVDVARKYDVSFTAVRKWRKKLGVPCLTVAAVLRRHAGMLGLCPDTEVAVAAGVTVEQVANYRRKHAIPMAWTHPLTTEEAQADIARLPVSEVVARYGVCRSAVTYQRRAKGLPLLRRNLEAWEVDAITRTAGEETDTDIAEALGRSAAAVNKVRREHDLSSWREQRKEMQPQRVAELRKRFSQGADVPKEA